MTAQELYNSLKALSVSGCDLSKMRVITEYTEYDSSIPYDMGKPATVYIEEVDAEHYELVLR